MRVIVFCVQPEGIGIGFNRQCQKSVQAPSPDNDDDGRIASSRASLVCILVGQPLDEMETFRPGHVSRVSYAHVTSTTSRYTVLSIPIVGRYDFSMFGHQRYDMIIGFPEKRHIGTRYTTIVTTKQYDPYYDDMYRNMQGSTIEWHETQVNSNQLNNQSILLLFF